MLEIRLRISFSHLNRTSDAPTGAKADRTAEMSAKSPPEGRQTAAAARERLIMKKAGNATSQRRPAMSEQDRADTLRQARRSEGMESGSHSVSQQ
jgi:hypothetical protein